MNIAEIASLPPVMLDFATRKHAGQTRGDGEDSITHSMAVAASFEDVEENWSLRVISLGHDLIDVTDTTKEEIAIQFGQVVADAIHILSRQEGDSYVDFILRIIDSGDIRAIKVKIADITHNCSNLIKGSMKDKYSLAKILLEQALVARLV